MGRTSDRAERAAIVSELGVSVVLHVECMLSVRLEDRALRTTQQRSGTGDQALSELRQLSLTDPRGETTVVDTDAGDLQSLLAATSGSRASKVLDRDPRDAASRHSAAQPASSAAITASACGDLPS